MMTISREIIRQLYWMRHKMRPNSGVSTMLVPYNTEVPEDVSKYALSIGIKIVKDVKPPIESK